MYDLRRVVVLCLLLAGTAACDRATKHFAMTTLAGGADQSFLSDTVRLTYHENPGAFWASAPDGGRRCALPSFNLVTACSCS